MRNIFILILFFSCSKESVNDNNECNNNYDPPFGGTIFIDPDIITEDDPTTSLVYHMQELVKDRCMIGGQVG